ncbi:MAG: glycosyltransferase [Candidatus Gastranaerophilales bacterium]|nr:glycosyltransferase [Candidatus Gastranaerophilales bacterium]
MNKKHYISAFIFIFFSIVFILGITYVGWRWIYTLNLYTSPFTTFWSYTLCVAEILTLVVFTNFGLILLKANSLEKIVPNNQLQQDYYKDVFHNRQLLTFKNYCPRVDIFICTLNESADMLSTTISACRNINYPNYKVYVLDDGKREEIKELTSMLGCNYITRETNKGFKAGNINNALSQTDGEIVVIFDADHIPASTFLRETVYNFIDEKVALVQTPQHFCNPDAFQKNLEMPDFLSNEQDIFYRVIEPSLNEFDSVFCGGTNILIRRKYLEAVGNFPETTITEDSLLGLIFHAKGYKVIYYNRPIAIGIAASNFEEYIKQRTRLAKGNVQIVTNPDNWKYYAKLTFVQAFFYLSGVLYFFTPIARIIYLLAPVLFLFFDISPLLILFYQIAAFQVCYFSLKFAFIFAARIRVNNVIFADVYDLLTSIFTIGGILQAFFLHGKLAKIKFTVTKKDTKKSKTNYSYKLPLIIIFLILILAEMQGIYDIMYSEPYSVLAIVANLFWNTTNIIVMYFGIKVVTEKPEKRYYQRVKADEDLTLEDAKHHKYNTHINNISRSGLSITSPENLENNHKEDLNADIQGEENPIEILGCEKEKEEYVCKSIFKEPFILSKITKRFVDRLNRFVKLTYKKPDKWDDYFEDESK